MAALPKTARGRKTRERILAAASQLINERGVAETSLDDVLEHAGVGKGQLYHYFPDRAALLRAVVLHNADNVLTFVGGPLDSWKGIRSLFDAMVALQVERCARGGCPIGALVGQLAEADEEARRALAHSFARWEARLGDGLRAMQLQGKLDPGADTGRLATATLAAMQGGLVLAQARRDPAQLAIALDAAYAHLRTYAPTQTCNDRTTIKD